MSENQYRQGDVFLQRAESVSLAGALAVARLRGRVVLAEGEKTGHAHAITDKWAKLFELADERYLVLPEEARLTHEEHGAIVLDPGTYCVSIQREYTPRELPRNVLD